MVFTEVNGKASAFQEIKGRMLCQTKAGSLEMLFTKSNTGDKGANEKQNLFMKFIEGDREAEGITNTKVNLKNPVAKQRGCKFVILDVSSLKLEDN